MLTSDQRHFAERTPRDRIRSAVSAKVAAQMTSEVPAWFASSRDLAALISDGSGRRGTRSRLVFDLDLNWRLKLVA